nr:hypothetical protein [Planctomycetota bacterium]
MSAHHPLPPALTATIAAFAARRRRLQVMRGSGDAIVTIGIGIAVLATIDALALPGYGPRLAMSLLVLAAGLGVAALRFLKPLIRPPTRVELARALERAAGGLDERLSAAIELSLSPNSGVSNWMVERTIALAALDAATLDVHELVDAGPARRAWTRAVVLTAVMLVSCAVSGAGALYLRALWPMTAAVRPSEVSLTVSPGDQLLALGSSLAIEAIAAPDPGGAHLEIVWQDGVREQVEMRRRDDSPASAPFGTYVYHVDAVTSAFTYQVRAGDAESRRCRIAVGSPPRVSRVALRVTPPEYTRLPVRDISGGDAQIVAGSTVAAIIEVQGEPVASATMVTAAGESAAVIETLSEGNAEGTVTRITAEFKPGADLAYGVRLVADSGLATEPAQRWLITVVPDRPPESALSYEGGTGGEDPVLGTTDTAHMTLAATDDLALKKVWLEVVDDRGHLTTRTLPSERMAVSVSIPVVLDLSVLGIASGDVLEVTALASDFGGQTTRSRAIRILAADPGGGGIVEQANRVRHLLARLDAQAETLRGHARTWSGLSRTGGAENAAHVRGDLLLMR